MTTTRSSAEVQPRRRATLAHLGVLSLAALAWTACGCREDASDPAAVPTADALENDRRVQELLAGCARSEFYDRDLSEPVSILVEKLERGRPDPLKRAKEELGLLGEQAMPNLANAFLANYTDPSRSAFLENVLDALAFNRTDESHELQLGALQHPQESVRSKALDGLLRSAGPADFDLLVDRLGIETPELRRQTVPILFRADRARAEDLLLGYFERGDARDLWANAAQEFTTTQDARSASRCAALFAGLEDSLGASLAAGAARNGHAEALEHLRAAVASEEGQRRLTAVHALDLAGLLDELGPVLLRDAWPELRAIAASALGREPLTPDRREWLRVALNDGDEGVQAAALAALCGQDDEEGVARGLAQLDGHVGELQSALLALRNPLRRRPELAREAYARLLQRHALEEHRPVAQRAATFKAIGQMPLADAARFLHEMGVAAGAETIEGLRAHDWLMIQASNTDVAGRTWLASALRSEADPLRRLDLVDAVGSVRDDLARTELLLLAEDAARSPLERLFAVNVLIRIGPSWELAPRIKRVAFSMQSPAEAKARTGIQCLLWHWY